MLVEGRWGTGAGIAARDVEAIVRSRLEDVMVRPLPESVYWGKEIDDERYLLVGRTLSR